MHDFFQGGLYLLLAKLFSMRRGVPLKFRVLFLDTRSPDSYKLSLVYCKLPYHIKSTLQSITQNQVSFM